MFFSDYDVEQIAYASWLWDSDHKLTARSWESTKAQYRARASFIVQVLNNEVAA